MTENIMGIYDEIGKIDRDRVVVRLVREIPGLPEAGRLTFDVCQEEKESSNSGSRTCTTIEVSAQCFIEVVDEHTVKIYTEGSWEKSGILNMLGIGQTDLDVPRQATALPPRQTRLPKKEW